MKRFSSFLLFIFIIGISACSQRADKTDAANEDVEDTVQLVQRMLYGLWSLDSGNLLVNQGFYFRNDGSVEFVASSDSGTWLVPHADTLKISYSTSREIVESVYNIDSISDSRMILSDGDGTYIFRKVPFGANINGEVLTGFSGTLESGMTKEYSFSLPSAKKIEIRLNSTSPEVLFRVFENGDEITAAPLRDLKTIMIRSGMYSVRISYSGGHKNESSDFDLKVIGY